MFSPAARAGPYNAPASAHIANGGGMGGRSMGKAAAKCRKLLGLGMAIVPLATISLIGAADAKITRIEIAKTTPAFEGAMFGAVGAYEQLDGTGYGEIEKVV